MRITDADLKRICEKINQRRTELGLVGQLKTNWAYNRPSIILTNENPYMCEDFSGRDTPETIYQNLQFYWKGLRHE